MSSLIASFVLTALIYTGIPLLIAKISFKWRMEKKNAISLVVINALVFYLIFTFLKYYLAENADNQSAPNVSAAFIWSIVAYRIIRKKNAPEKDVSVSDEKIM